MKKSIKLVAVFGLLTLLHAGLTVGASLFRFVAGMEGLETGQAPTMFEQATGALTLALQFPFVHVARSALGDWFPGLWGYAPILFNSAFWAALLTVLRHTEIERRSNSGG
jgi:hypothetical protein